MMDAIRKYLISLCAAALLCALVRALVPGGRMKKLCSLLCGIFLMTLILSLPSPVRAETACTMRSRTTALSAPSQTTTAPA